MSYFRARKHRERGLNKAITFKMLQSQAKRPDRSIEMESRTVGALGGWEVSVSWGQSFGFARWKILERMVVMAAQGCECISCHLKEVSIVHFMWCVFYHQTKKNLFRKERFASTRAFRPTGSDLEPFTNHYSPDKMLKCVHQKTFCGGFVNF